ncbi:pilus assembly protein [Roseibium polysiphoniae]|uniref:Pilus assembly protein n=4 Tax=Roseibium TaxID=150830 RepID=A0A944CFN6_9HYPH|nr:pilus assembly protein [Roseibium polysiphoniae]
MKSANKNCGPIRSSRRFSCVTSLLGHMLRRYTKDRNGVTAIEFAAVGLPFLMLVFGLFEFGLAFFVNRVLDNATLESARLIRTGQAHQGSFDAAAFKTEVCTNMTGVLCQMSRLTIDVQTYSDFAGLDDLTPLLDEDGELEEDTDFEIGSASDIVVARVVYRWPMFTSMLRTDAGDTGNMERLLFSTVIFRNEPFPW